jgi:hypothetical protein
MPKKPRGIPPSQRTGHRPGGAHRYRPLRIDPLILDLTYQRTLSSKSPQPVVFLINTDDPVGAKLGLEMVGREAFEEASGDYRHSPEAARLTLGVESEEDAVAILSFTFPGTAAAFKTPLPPEHYRVVVVEAGEMKLHSRPIPTGAI